MIWLLFSSVLGNVLRYEFATTNHLNSLHESSLKQSTHMHDNLLTQGFFSISCTAFKDEAVNVSLAASGGLMATLGSAATVAATPKDGDKFNQLLCRIKCRRVGKARISLSRKVLRLCRQEVSCQALRKHECMYISRRFSDQLSNTQQFSDGVSKQQCVRGAENIKKKRQP
jgi:hypothetical protein